MSRTSITPCFVIKQALAKFGYVWYIFGTLGHYCKKLPRFSTSVRDGVPNYGLTIITRAYPVIIVLYELFYEMRDGHMVKRVSLDMLPYLTPLCLAYWIMDDGTYNHGNILLCTDGFTHDEVYLLAAMLHYNLGLVCTTQKFGKGLRLYVTAKSIPKLRALVAPYIIPSMLYKIDSRR